MYRKHFGLTRHPFGKEVEPDDLFGLPDRICG